MDRVYQQFERYNTLTETVKQELESFGKIIQHPKGSYYKQADETLEKWCFILEGLVAKEHYNADGKLIIERICEANACFVGTKHPFSKTGEPVAIKFLQTSLIYEIRNTRLQELVKKHQDLHAVYHIYVQHKLNHSNRHIHRTNSLPSEQRLHDLYLDRPNLLKLLTVEQKCAFLKFANNESYYKAKRYHDKKTK